MREIAVILRVIYLTVALFLAGVSAYCMVAGPLWLSIAAAVLSVICIVVRSSLPEAPHA